MFWSCALTENWLGLTHFLSLCLVCRWMPCYFSNWLTSTHFSHSLTTIFHYELVSDSEFMWLKSALIFGQNKAAKKWVNTTQLVVTGPDILYWCCPAHLGRNLLMSIPTPHGTTKLTMMTTMLVKGISKSASLTMRGPNSNTQAGMAPVVGTNTDLLAPPPHVGDSKLTDRV